jgi:hypothetical protein
MALVWDKALFESQYSCVGWSHGIRGTNKVPRFHYNWYGRQAHSKRMVDTYMTYPGFAQVSDVVVIGGAFGWTSEVLSTYGINSVSVDTSPYILAAKDVSEEQELRDYLTNLGFDPDALNNGAAGIRFMSPNDPNSWVNPWDYWLRPDGKKTSATVVDEDMSTVGSRNAIKQAIGGNIDVIITEFAIDAMDAGDDAASLSLIERCEQLRSNPSVVVIHLIGYNPYDVMLNIKTAQEWRTFLDTNGYDHVVMDLKEGTILMAGD